METQLVRLDAPYNLICNEDGEFGLHIATLMVINQRDDDHELNVQSYPVVASKYDLGGRTWFNDELQDCKVVAVQGGNVSLRDIKLVTEFASLGEHLLDLLVMSLMTTLRLYNVKVSLDRSERGELKVELCFSGPPKGRIAVYSATDSPFFLYTYYDPEAENRIHPIAFSQSQAIDEILKTRQVYLTSLRIVDGAMGVKDITFYTNQPKYKYFVDELNKKAHANGK